VTRLRDFFSKANRLQKTRLFKLAATAALLIAAVSLLVAYAIRMGDAPELPQVEIAAPQAGEAVDPVAAARERDMAAKTREILESAVAARTDVTGAAIAVSLVTGLAVAVVWLGLGLTYLGLAAATALLVLLLKLFNAGQTPIALVVGIAALTASFTALLRLVGLLLSSASPVSAIARNVLDEAVRMKISLVFIVLIIFGLAALPGLLDQSTFLRYRVQSFIQYGTGGTFWLIAVLALTFSASSVTFEQRDKVIWQTMTKPVAAWQYVLGKWLGMVALSGILLGVSASGVFLFTEYLRGQPATGEAAPYEVDETGRISEDRFILETQVLAARETKMPDPIPIDEKQMRENVEARIQAEVQKLRDSGERDAMLRMNIDEIRRKMLTELPEAVQVQYRAIAQGAGREFTFSGLKHVRDSRFPLVLRFKLNAGSNMPDREYRLTILVMNESEPRLLVAPLNQFVTLRPPLLPTVIDENGELKIRIYNGDFTVSPPRFNEEAIFFPPDGIELSYSAGGYRINFFRCIAVLWVKLAFLSMLAICASTFLSFPVACLVAFTTFLAAEGAGFIHQSLESYATEDREGNMLLVPTIIAKVAEGVSTMFKVYSDLKPTTRLVEGLRLSWGQMGGGVAVLGLATAVLYGLAAAIFRKRELATYSGH